MAALKSLLAVAFVACSVSAQNTTTQAAAYPTSTTCASTIAPRHGQPSVAPGWHVQVVASGLTKPRGIAFDSEGNLLVVQQGYGISRLNLTSDAGACVRAQGNATDIIVNKELNHGIDLSVNGTTLYGSTSSAVYAWDYDASQGRNTSASREIIGHMGGDDGHVTRTLLISRQVDGMLLVSRGSMGNLDPAAQNFSTAVSTIKAFNVSNVTDTAYNFAQDGVLLGWGLRNSVGVGEEPLTGAIYSVENSVDELQRSGEDIHQNNPGEELNFHGYLNGSQTEEQGRNYGYPSCFAAWNVSAIPNNQNIQVGTQFAIGDQNATSNDTFCQQGHVAPRLTFEAHMAPLDIKFNSNGTTAWVSFHGSWNRDAPIGYKLSAISFANGEPTQPANSSTPYIDIMTNPDLSRCPDECFRPVGLAWDTQGRLFMSSDATGEIYVVVRANGGSADGASPTSGLSPSGTGGAGSSPSPSPSQGVAMKKYGGMGGLAAVVAGVMAWPFV